MVKHILLILICMLILTTSCGPIIEITSEYATSSDWGKSDNSMYKADISIRRIVLKDTTINIFNEDFKLEDILKNYKFDSAFCFALYYTDNWRIKKIYFDREQKDILWLKECTTDLMHTTKVIGKLELFTWYRIEGIRHNHVYYVYVDKAGDTHVYTAFTALNW